MYVNGNPELTLKHAKMEFKDLKMLHTIGNQQQETTKDSEKADGRPMDSAFCTIIQICASAF